MCYDVAYLTKKLKRYAKHYGKEEDWQDIKKRLPPTYHAQCFDHPDLPVITSDQPNQVQALEWGLVPRWVKDPASATKISNSTLNARVEDMFSKPSYREAAKERHCLIIVDGFYEHHWIKDKSFPYFIHMKNNDPFSLAGLWDEWKGKRTASIVTTTTNSMMAEIHNKPKGSHEPRMPLIVPREFEEKWLQPVESNLEKEELFGWVGPYDQNRMESFTVPRLRGKAYKGNVPETMKHYRYEEIEPSQQGLF